MRRTLLISFAALLLVMGTAGAAPAVHAAAKGTTCTTTDNKTGTDDGTGKCIATATTAAPAASDAAAKISTDVGQSTDSAYGYIMTKIMSLFAWLVGVAAITLDTAVYYTVVMMGDYVKNLTAVGVAWRILRDLGNIALIFGFLAIGINVILGTDAYGWGQKLLPRLLMAAVALNFSLFFTEAIIDGGNLFATQFYTQINGGKPAGAPVNFDNIANATSGSIASKLMNQVGLQSLYGQATQSSKPLFSNGNPWYIGFMGIILFIVAAFVMFSLAFILIARFVALIFIIIVAPIGVVGFAVPKLSSIGQQWRDQLFSQTITAPILLLMLYIALAIITDVHFLTGFGPKPDWLGFIADSNGVTNFTGFASMILSFLVAMGLLLAVTMYAKKLGAWGTDVATKWGSRLSFGAASFVGRATLGSAGNVLASKRMQSWARSGPLKYPLRAAVLAGKGLRSATYDIRNAPGVATGFGALGDAGTGKGATFTAKQAHDAQYGWKPTKEWLQESAAERQQAGREMDFKNAQADLAAGRITQDQFDTIATPILSKMTTKQLEELGGIRKGIEALVRNLSPEQFESLMKSDKFNEIEKEKMRGGRYSSLNAAIGAGAAAQAGSPAATAARDAVRQWSAKDLATAAPDILNNPVQAASFVSLMSEGQFDAVVKNDKLSKGQQQQLRDFGTQGKIFNYLDIANGVAPRTPAFVTAGVIPAGMTQAAATTAAEDIMKKMSPKKLAKLHGGILTSPLAMSLLTPKHLAAFMTDGDLDPSQIHTIANEVTNAAHPNHAAFATYLNPATNPIAASYWV